jgi:molybdopterin-containing oxidoreductase family iron-sulfur binding subunit
VRDGEITTACEQACPTRAIVFGDLSDADSRVARLHADPRSYAMLDELNVKPRVKYMARLRNRSREGGSDTERKA